MITIYALTSWQDGGKCEALGAFPSPEAAILATHPAVVTLLGRPGEKLRPVRPGVGAIKMTGLPEYQVAEQEVERDGSPEYDAAVLREAAEIIRARYGLLTSGDIIKALRTVAGQVHPPAESNGR